ncbi:hypothetical protein [Taklimakanibacter deserti]|uniref:hypothetical protein n=1 Tax=Taklimakanibacter deserti TaxID=2267839 RepID=UPI0013C5050D
MSAETSENLVVPSCPREVAEYLVALLRDHGDEPESIKAGVRFSILALKRMERGFLNC